MHNYNYIINFQKTLIETNKMSDIVDQIDKLKDKAHKLKEGVSNKNSSISNICADCNTEKIFGGSEKV